MDAVAWSDIQLAELNGVRGIRKYQAEITPENEDPDITRRVTFYPHSVVGYRTRDPVVVTMGDCSVNSYEFTDASARESWRAHEIAEHALMAEAVTHGAALKRRPEQFRLALSTGTVTSKDTTAPHPYPPNVRDSVGVIKSNSAGVGITLAVQDVCGEVHLMKFNRPVSDDRYALLWARAPYPLCSERVVRVTFEAVRAAQRHLLDEGRQLARNALISLEERPQVRVSDEESEDAEDWLTIDAIN